MSSEITVCDLNAPIATIAGYEKESVFNSVL